MADNIFVKVKEFHLNVGNVVEVNPVKEYFDKDQAPFYKLEIETVNGMKNYVYRNKEEADTDFNNLIMAKQPLLD
jgi:hypothetical protein